MTSKPSPRYCAIVFAFAGDSTMTSFLLAGMRDPLLERGREKKLPSATDGDCPATRASRTPYTGVPTGASVASWGLPCVSSAVGRRAGTCRRGQREAEQLLRHRDGGRSVLQGAARQPGPVPARHQGRELARIAGHGTARGVGGGK